MFPTTFEGIYCFVLYSFVVIIFRDKNLLRYRRSIHYPLNDLDSKILTLIIAIYCITDFVDLDYFHYKDYIIQLNKYNVSDLEVIYDLIAKSIKYNYIGFRIIVWGCASVSLYLIFKICNINLIHALYTFFVIYIGLFGYARASLGMAFFFLGYSLFITKKHKITGILILTSSIIFHRSMIFPIALSFLPIINWKKKYLLILLCTIPILVIVVNHTLSSYLMLMDINNEVALGKLHYYSNQENELNKLSYIGRIHYILGFIIFLLPLILSVYATIKNKHNNGEIPNIINAMFQMALIICMLSIVFEFIDLSTKVIAYRIRYMSMIPLCICFIYFVDKKIINFKFYKTCIYCGIAYVCMNIISVIRQSM